MKTRRNFLVCILRNYAYNFSQGKKDMYQEFQVNKTGFGKLLSVYHTFVRKNKLRGCNLKQTSHNTVSFILIYRYPVINNLTTYDYPGILINPTNENTPALRHLSGNPKYAWYKMRN